jgi:hypothetical protein
MISSRAFAGQYGQVRHTPAFARDRPDNALGGDVDERNYPLAVELVLPRSSVGTKGRRDRAIRSTCSYHQIRMRQVIGPPRSFGRAKVEILVRTTVVALEVKPSSLAISLFVWSRYSLAICAAARMVPAAAVPLLSPQMKARTLSGANHSCSGPPPSRCSTWCARETLAARHQLTRHSWPRNRFSIY